MLKKMFLFVFLLFVSGYVYSDSDDFSCVKFGDHKITEWLPLRPDAAHQEAIMQEEKKEVKALFKNELKDFDSKLDKAKIVNALTHLIEYENELIDNEDFYTVCVRLDNVHLKNPQYKFIFQPKQIGEVCYFKQQVREKLSDEIRGDFVSALKNKNIPKSFLSMLNEASYIMLSEEKLSQYIHEQEIQAKTKLKSIESTKCISLFVYPVELYTVLSSEKISIFNMLPPIESDDDKGNKGEFYIIVVEKDYHWKIGKLELDVIIKTDTYTKTSKPVDFEHWLGYPEFQKKINELIGIVNIGMASCGGRLQIENNRAKARARKLTKWVSRTFRQNNNLKVYGLNLGKHRYSGTECKQLSAEMRDSQRRILLIGITKNSDPELDIESALQNAMKTMADSQPNKLPINPSDYHLFDLIEN